MLYTAITICVLLANGQLSQDCQTKISDNGYQTEQQCHAMIDFVLSITPRPLNIGGIQYEFKQSRCATQMEHDMSAAKDLLFGE